MKDWVKSHKNEIFVGIVVFFITSLVTTIGKWLVFSGPTVGGSILSKMRDLIFVIAAGQNGHKFLEYLFNSLLILFLAFIAILLLSTTSFIRKKDSEEKLLKQLNDLKSCNKEELENKKEEIELLHKKIEKNMKKRDKRPSAKELKVKARIAFVLAVLYIILMFMYLYLPVSLWNNFDIYATQIAPYVDEQEIKMIRSQWTRMRSYDDYKEIEEYINKIIEENHLKNE